MYDEGDDNMKKTLGEAMLKSRQDQAMGNLNAGMWQSPEANGMRVQHQRPRITGDITSTTASRSCDFTIRWAYAYLMLLRSSTQQATIRKFVFKNNINRS